MKNDGKCIHSDDMHDILTEILRSDILIFSFLLYVYGMSALLKALMDRMLLLGSMAMQNVGECYEHVAQADFSHLNYVMICGCGFPNSENNFEGMIKQFGLMFPHDNTIITVPESPMFNAPEAAEVTKPFLEVIRQAGREYAKDGKITDYTMSKLNTPMIPEDVYAQIVNGNSK